MKQCWIWYIKKSKKNPVLRFCTESTHSDRGYNKQRCQRGVRVCHSQCWVRVNAESVLNPASSDTVESEWRQMKQCWIKYIKNPKNLVLRFCTEFTRGTSLHEGNALWESPFTEPTRDENLLLLSQCRVSISFHWANAGGDPSRGQRTVIEAPINKDINSTWLGSVERLGS
jgi:hypothetical protein